MAPEPIFNGALTSEIKYTCRQINGGNNYELIKQVQLNSKATIEPRLNFLNDI